MYYPKVCGLCRVWLGNGSGKPAGSLTGRFTPVPVYLEVISKLQIEITAYKKIQKPVSKVRVSAQSINFEIGSSFQK
jgi:membrane carboxypeptidase/penicillin-binding protein PbpC